MRNDNLHLLLWRSTCASAVLAASCGTEHLPRLPDLESVLPRLQLLRKCVLAIDKLPGTPWARGVTGVLYWVGFFFSTGVRPSQSADRGSGRGAAGAGSSDAGSGAAGVPPKLFGFTTGVVVVGRGAAGMPQECRVQNL